jgi:hypothetical protein
VFEISTTEYSNRDFEIYNMKEQIKKFLNEEQDPKVEKITQSWNDLLMKMKKLYIAVQKTSLPRIVLF